MVVELEAVVGHEFADQLVQSSSFEVQVDLTFDILFPFVEQQPTSPAVS